MIVYINKIIVSQLFSAFFLWSEISDLIWQKFYRKDQNKIAQNNIFINTGAWDCFNRLTMYQFQYGQNPLLIECLPCWKYMKDWHYLELNSHSKWTMCSLPTDLHKFSVNTVNSGIMDVYKTLWRIAQKIEYPVSKWNHSMQLYLVEECGFRENYHLWLLHVGYR